MMSIVDIATVNVDLPIRKLASKISLIEIQFQTCDIEMIDDDCSSSYVRSCPHAVNCHSIASTLLPLRLAWALAADHLWLCFPCARSAVTVISTNATIFEVDNNSRVCNARSVVAARKEGSRSSAGVLRSNVRRKTGLSLAARCSGRSFLLQLSLSQQLPGTFELSPVLRNVFEFLGTCCSVSDASSSHSLGSSSATLVIPRLGVRMAC